MTDGAMNLNQAPVAPGSAGARSTAVFIPLLTLNPASGNDQSHAQPNADTMPPEGADGLAPVGYLSQPPPVMIPVSSSSTFILLPANYQLGIQQQPRSSGPSEGNASLPGIQTFVAQATAPVNAPRCSYLKTTMQHVVVTRVNSPAPTTSRMQTPNAQTAIGRSSELQWVRPVVRPSIANVPIQPRLSTVTTQPVMHVVNCVSVGSSTPVSRADVVTDVLSPQPVTTSKPRRNVQPRNDTGRSKKSRPHSEMKIKHEPLDRNVFRELSPKRRQPAILKSESPSPIRTPLVLPPDTAFKHALPVSASQSLVEAEEVRKQLPATDSKPTSSNVRGNFWSPPKSLSDLPKQVGINFAASELQSTDLTVAANVTVASSQSVTETAGSSSADSSLPKLTSKTDRLDKSEGTNFKSVLAENSRSDLKNDSSQGGDSKGSSTAKVKSGQESLDARVKSILPTMRIIKEGSSAAEVKAGQEYLDAKVKSILPSTKIMNEGSSAAEVKSCQESLDAKVKSILRNTAIMKEAWESKKLTSVSSKPKNKKVELLKTVSVANKCVPSTSGQSSHAKGSAKGPVACASQNSKLVKNKQLVAKLTSSQKVAALSGAKSKGGKLQKGPSTSHKSSLYDSLAVRQKTCHMRNDTASSTSFKSDNMKRGSLTISSDESLVADFTESSEDELEFLKSNPTVPKNWLKSYSIPKRRGESSQSVAAEKSGATSQSVAAEAETFESSVEPKGPTTYYSAVATKKVALGRNENFLTVEKHEELAANESEKAESCADDLCQVEDEDKSEAEETDVHFDAERAKRFSAMEITSGRTVYEVCNFVNSHVSKWHPNGMHETTTWDSSDYRRSFVRCKEKGLRLVETEWSDNCFDYCERKELEIQFLNQLQGESRGRIMACWHRTQFPSGTLAKPSNFIQVTGGRDFNKEYRWKEEGNLQQGLCLDLKSGVSRCRDCDAVRQDLIFSDNHPTNGIYCRFAGIRKLQRLSRKRSRLKRNLAELNCPLGYTIGFKTSADCPAEELNQEWLPDHSKFASDEFSPDDIVPIAYTLQQIACTVCRLVKTEEQIESLAVNLRSKKDLWRFSVGVRELCDVCAACIFNLHFFCESCGFQVCAQCVCDKFRGTPLNDWAVCTVSSELHEPFRLRLANLIPECAGYTLSTLLRLVIRMKVVMRKWRIVPRKLSTIWNDSKDECNCALENAECYCLRLNDVSTANPLLAPLDSPDGILWLANGYSKAALTHFQAHWRRGKPVIVAGVHKRLTSTLWLPQCFMEKFTGQALDNNLVDCRCGAILSGSNLTVDDFWLGFARSSQRLVGQDDRPFLLKLKDWPSSAKFSDALPEHYADFCQALPIADYTHPETGAYNLVLNLPPSAVRPDLGPKMYTAYEMIFCTRMATTNLHLDVSDAVNVMTYVGIPTGYSREAVCNDVISYVCSLPDCDEVSKRRVRENPEQAGALWSIYNPEDATDLRIFLGEKAKSLDGRTRAGAKRRHLMTDGRGDPIHDQLWFLDQQLRMELTEDRGVRGHTFVQMLGDAVFIPAGAAHQVQNLLCCIKVAEDFVSPEGVVASAEVSQEFRLLSVDHDNHEDKLQFQNILYHTVKNCTGFLEHCQPEAASTDILLKMEVTDSLKAGTVG